NNLPINIVSLQIEEEIERIPTKPWYFPELHTYEHFVRQSFVDQIEQADLVNAGISENLDEKIRTTVIVEDAERFKKRQVQICDAINNFSTAKSTLLTNQPVTRSKPQEIEKFRTDVMQVVTTATELKKNTKEFGFSNTSIPHDFIINADILRKSDLLADLLDQRVTKKKEELILGNFLKLNPGMEHAGTTTSGFDFDGKFADLFSRFDDHETKLTKLNSAFDTVNSKVNEHDVKFGEFNNQLSTHGTRVGDLNNRLTGVESKSGAQESKITDLFGKVTGVENKVNTNEAKVSDIGSKMTLITNRVVESENKVGGFGSVLTS